MTAREDLSHRIIIAVKYSLLSAALMGLAVLFFFLREAPVSPNQPFLEAGVRGVLKQGIEAPIFQGSTESGVLVSVGAANITPRPVSDLVEATKIHAAFNVPNGPQYDLKAQEGHIWPSRKTAQFTNGVSASSSEGFSFDTDHIDVALAPIEIKAPNLVFARHPLGQIEAGQMLLKSDAALGAVKILFQGGVRLLYTPQPQ